MSELLAETAHGILAMDDPWPALEEAGLTLVGVPEEAGGSGGTVEDAAVLLRAAGYHGAAVPLAETWLAGRLLAAAGLPVPRGPLTAFDGRGMRRVPWARSAHRIVMLGVRRVVIIDPGDSAVTITRGENLAGEPRDDLTLLDRPDLPESTPCAVPFTDLLRWGALARAVQLTGAMRRALELSVRYAGEREQFGRPIGRFQAVQHLLAEMAGEVTVADVAVRAAVRSPDDPLAVAAAKADASRAAGTVATIAHQVHGAIGVTGEHPLRTVTLRLWSWREEYGDEHFWATETGRLLGDRDPWELMTAPSTVTGE